MTRASKDRPIFWGHQVQRRHQKKRQSDARKSLILYTVSVHNVDLCPRCTPELRRGDCGDAFLCVTAAAMPSDEYLGLFFTVYCFIFCPLLTFPSLDSNNYVYTLKEHHDLTNHLSFLKQIFFIIITFILWRPENNILFVDCIYVSKY